MSRSLLATLRVLLIVLFAAALAAQAFSGMLASTILEGSPAMVLVGLIAAGALCVEVVLVSVWMLVAMVEGGKLFDERAHSDRWVNAAIGALLAAAVIAVVGFAYFGAAAAIRAAGTTAALSTSTLAPASISLTLCLAAAAAAGAAAALALLVVVMRRLLHTAIQLQSELAEVI
ncbi:DUF2975 domain-containing protein [Subtercola lobariae]|uniref:DUF2975 domain-containing protein n=1 Tax=Subtercola lobariae TaxID=1588641 RepID=A0A917F0A2_9MICO|nr:DUF2975 domain-containing protein [Subtercola lobariae]GGF39356.1 hypothetical protein GCM10011399_35310 [Subtercola lobariae]